MNASADIRTLAAREAASPPYGFEEFERRRAGAVRRGRITGWSLAASVAVLGLVSLLAVVTQPPPDGVVGELPGAPSAVPAAGTYELPALVELDRFVLTSELEDHIALLDAQISAARIHAAPPERLREMESTREQLNESLQRVSYAHSLLSL